MYKITPFYLLPRADIAFQIHEKIEHKKLQFSNFYQRNIIT